MHRLPVTETSFVTDLKLQRARRQNWGQLILSAFVLSWLSVSLQPCLMAMESGSDLATAVATAPGHADHVVHDGHTAGPDVSVGGAICENCPPMDCTAVAACSVEISSECIPDVPYNLDNRRDKIVLKDLPADPPVSISPGIGIATPADHDVVLSSVHVSSHTPGIQQPLNLLNCIYLI